MNDADPEIFPDFVNHSKLSARAYAAIHLRVPNSGIDWLDEMIREANTEREIGEMTTMTLKEFEAHHRLYAPTIRNCVSHAQQPDYLDGNRHEWAGGERPVPPRMDVVAELRNGVVSGLLPAGALTWAHNGDANDIIRFRVVKP